MDNIAPQILTSNQITPYQSSSKIEVTRIETLSCCHLALASFPKRGHETFCENYSSVPGLVTHLWYVWDNRVTKNDIDSRYILAAMRTDACWFARAGFCFKTFSNVIVRKLQGNFKSSFWFFNGIRKTYPLAPTMNFYIDLNILCTLLKIFGLCSSYIRKRDRKSRKAQFTSSSYNNRRYCFHKDARP